MGNPGVFISATRSRYGWWMPHRPYPLKLVADACG